MKSLDKEEYYNIAKKLENHHPLFYKFWEMGTPIFSEKNSTAWVEFDEKGGQIGFYFNPNFWDSITDYERLFIICHESLHILLKHGLRTKNSEDKQSSNIALDIVVNHMLENSYKFDRNLLNSNMPGTDGKIKDETCWIDTVFKDRLSEVERDKSYEYYYNLISKNGSGDGGKKSTHSSKSGCPQTIDNHEGLEGLADSKVIDQIVSDALESFNDSEKNSIYNVIKNEFEGKMAGTMPGNLSHFADVKPVKKKKKWETIIKKWEKKSIINSNKNEEQWVRTNRRFVCLSNDLIIPTEMEIDENEKEKSKIEVWFFQDTSGSCAHLKDRLFNAAKTLPTNKFEVRLFCFDTSVYETSLSSGKLYGFGGTSFSAIERYICAKISMEKLRYPKAVFVLTDGFGDTVKPKYPKNWNWFLTGNYRKCIPNESNVFLLSDFE